MLCKTVVTRDRRYITQITCYEKGSTEASETTSERLPSFGKQTGGGALASLFNFPTLSNRRKSESNQNPRTRQQLQLLTSK